MLRCLGATKWELFFALVLEGLLLSALGVALGFASGHTMVELLGSWLQDTRGVDISWKPIVVEGRFETVARSTGSVYRLHDAKLVSP